MVTTHVPLVVNKHTTRAEIQAEITHWRREQRRLPAFAAEYAELIDEPGGYLDALLALEPEPA